MNKQVSVIGCLLLASVLAGCRPATRIAWAAESRGGGPLLPWPAAPLEMEQDRLRQAKGLSHFLAGLVAEGQGDLDSASKEYRQATAYDPDALQIVLRLGFVSMRREELPKAIESFEAASRLDPADSRPHFLLGVLYTSQERFQEASEQYSQILAQDPGHLGALTHLADLYLLQERIQEALAVYERLLKERPDSAGVHFNVGVLYTQAGLLPDGIWHLRQAVELDPVNLEARLGLGVSLELAGRLEAARQEFLGALQLEPANTRLIRYLAQVSYQMEDMEGAAQWLGRYLSFQPRDPRGYLELGSLRIEQGRWRDGVQLLKAGLELQNFEEPPVQLLISLGLAYQTGGVPLEAEKAYQQAVDMAPQEPRPYLYLGALYHEMGRFQEAEAAFRDGYRVAPDSPAVLNALGYLYADWGVRLEEGLMLINQAISLDPENAAYLDSLGWIYFRMGRLAEALKLLKESGEREPDPELFDHLGQVYLSLGNRREAEAAFKQGLALKPKNPEGIRRLEQRLKELKARKR